MGVLFASTWTAPQTTLFVNTPPTHQTSSGAGRTFCPGSTASPPPRPTTTRPLSRAAAATGCGTSTTSSLWPPTTGGATGGCASMAWISS